MAVSSSRHRANSESMWRSRLSGLCGRVLQRDDSFPVLERERWREHLAEGFEHRCADANRHRHREAADERQPAVLDEHPKAEPRVGRNRIEPLPPRASRPASLYFSTPPKRT